MSWLGFIASIVIGIGAGCIGSFSNLWVKRIEASLAERDRNRAIALKIKNLAPDPRKFLERFINESNGISVNFQDVQALELSQKGLIRSIDTGRLLTTKEIFYVLVDDVAPVLRDILSGRNSYDENSSDECSAKCCKKIVKIKRCLNRLFCKRGG